VIVPVTPSSEKLWEYRKMMLRASKIFASRKSTVIAALHLLGHVCAQGGARDHHQRSQCYQPDPCPSAVTFRYLRLMFTSGIGIG
jgi:hypothetical protein